MKRYDIAFIDPVTKTVANQTVTAENKKEARKNFKNMYYVPYKVLSVDEIKD